MPRQDLIQLRAGTASAWTTANPILAAGEPGVETDTNKLKIGNGVTAWNSLAYTSGGSGGGGAVDSVNGRTGAVTLTKSDVGLANVDNTSDANKPVSTATQTALDGKANTVHTHSIAQITGLQTDLNNLASSISGKQDILSSGTNIKTINGSSILGSGDLSLSGSLDGGFAASVYGGSNTINGGDANG